MDWKRGYEKEDKETEVNLSKLCQTSIGENQTTGRMEFVIGIRPRSDQNAALVQLSFSMSDFVQIRRFFDKVLEKLPETAKGLLED